MAKHEEKWRQDLQKEACAVTVEACKQLGIADEDILREEGTSVVLLALWRQVQKMKDEMVVRGYER